VKLILSKASPYARLAWVVMLEKGLEPRLEVVFTQTRIPNDPLFKIHPSGRLPCLILDDGTVLEDSRLVCAYLDALDGAPAFAPPQGVELWQYWRREETARSLLDGLAVWVRELRRPENERSPGIIRHETERARRMVDVLERDIGDAVWQGALNLPQIVLLTALQIERRMPDFAWREGHPGLVAWEAALAVRPSLAATALPA